MHLSRFCDEGFPRLSLLISPVLYGTYGTTGLSANVIIGLLPELSMLWTNNAHFCVNTSIDGFRVVVSIAVDLSGTSYYLSYSTLLRHIDGITKLSFFAVKNAKEAPSVLRPAQTLQTPTQSLQANPPAQRGI